MTRSMRGSAQDGRIGKVWPGGILVLLLLVSTRTFAADVEIRDFRIKIDNKAAGSYTMSITEGREGKAVMTGLASIDVRIYLIRYTYSYSGTETWRGNRLHILKSEANDDGKQYAVQAQAQSDQNSVVVWTNGKQRVTYGDVWTTTYWRLPNPVAASQQVHLLDADTGKDILGTIQPLGKWQVNVAGQIQICDHYHITGDKLDVKLWYDARNRLVREELREDGHTMVMELTSIR
jgi:hypothetical protein